MKTGHSESNLNNKEKRDLKKRSAFNIKWTMAFLAALIVMAGAAALGDVYINSMETKPDFMVQTSGVRTGRLNNTQGTAAHGRYITSDMMMLRKLTAITSEYLGFYSSQQIPANSDSTETPVQQDIFKNILKERDIQINAVNEKTEDAIQKNEYFENLKKDLIKGERDGGLYRYYSDLDNELSKRIETSGAEKGGSWLIYAEEARYHAKASRLAYERLISGGSGFLYEDIMLHLDKLNRALSEMNKAMEVSIHSNMGDIKKMVRDSYARFLDAHNERTIAVNQLNDELQSYMAFVNKMNEDSGRDVHQKENENHSTYIYSGYLLIAALFSLSLLFIFSSIYFVMQSKSCKEGKKSFHVDGENIVMDTMKINIVMENKRSFNAVNWNLKYKK